MNKFTIRNADTYEIVADDVETIESPLDWQKRGLRQTASGYGSKLTTSVKVPFNGKLYRVYCTIYSNSGTCWFIANGQRYIVD
jgi:hypothetical protein